MKVIGSIRHLGLKDGATIEFDNFDDTAQCMVLLKKGLKVGGYPVREVYTTFEYIKDEEELKDS